MIRRLVKSIQEKLPSEYKNSSLIVFSILYILWRIIEGVLSRIGELITEKITPILPGVLLEVWKVIFSIFSYSIPVNIFQIFLFIIIILPVYRLISREILKRAKKGIIFEDDFEFGNKGWHLNYRGTNDPDKTCRIEQSCMVFEADDSDLTDPKKENGAYIDLGNRIYQGSRYEISCWVKSDKNTTMGFKLWVHDTRGNAEMKNPSFCTPGMEYEKVSVDFIGTQRQALRIHLHYRAGEGKIFVDKVTVTKL